MCKCRENKCFGTVNALRYFLESTHGRGYRIRTRSNKSDFENKKKEAVIMNYIMGLPRFGIQKNSRHNKDITGTCKTTQENVSRSNKRNSQGYSDRKKKSFHRTHNPFAIGKGSTERR